MQTGYFCDKEEIPKEIAKRMESICLLGEENGGAGNCQFDSLCITLMKNKNVISKIRRTILFIGRREGGT